MMKSLPFKKSFQYYCKVFTSDFRTYGLFILTSAFFLWMSQTNWISHSEYWSIACGKLFGTLDSDSLFIYMRPLFYVPLSLPFLFDLDNIQHVMMARSFFGVLASINLYLCFLLVRNLGFSKQVGLFYCAFLLSFHVVFYNFFRVRSDFLCLFFLLIGLNLMISEKGKSWKNLPFHPLLPISIFAMSLTTPKSAYPIVWLFVLYLFLAEKKTWLKRISRSLLVIALPASLFVLMTQVSSFSGLIIDEVFAMTLKYYIDSFQQSWSYENFSLLLRSLRINFLHYGFLIVSLAFFFKVGDHKSKKGKTLIILFSLALVTLFIHPERWDYFIAMLIPFLSLPILYGISNLAKLKYRLGALLILILVPMHMTYYKPWWNSNQLQLERMEQLSLVLDHFQNVRLFDATGILPRANNALWFLGINDTYGNLNTVQKVSTEKPELILKTPKFEFGGPDLIIVLHKNYEEVGPGFWVLKELADDFKSIHYPPWQRSWGSIFVYDLPPRVRPLW